MTFFRGICGQKFFSPEFVSLAQPRCTLQNPKKVFVRVKFVFLRRFNQAVDHGAGLCTTGRIVVHIVTLTTHMHIADPDKGILGANGIVGAGHNIAVGNGLSASYRGTDQVCVCFFGDASTNQGTFHESLNMAAIWKLPIIFVCENNNYGISMSQARHQAIKDIETAQCFGTAAQKGAASAFADAAPSCFFAHSLFNFCVTSSTMR